MRYSTVALRDVVAKATPLHDRWQGGVVACLTDQRQVESRQQQWQRVLSVEGNAEALRRRLAGDGVTEAICMPLLGPVRWADAEPLPAWAGLLQSLVQQCKPIEDAAELPSSPVLDPQAALPFEHLWLSFVEAAGAELRTRAGGVLHQLSDGALRNIQGRLLTDLAFNTANALALEFQLFQMNHDPLAGVLPPDPEAPASSHLYRQFIVHMLDGGLLGFLESYPVLARLVSVAVDQWADSVVEFCRRLDEDQPALVDLFNQGRELGQVTHVRMGLSDAHHHGRSVIIAGFDSGLKIVYKPKDLGIDRAFFGLIEWLNEQGCPLPLRSLQVLNRTAYGWIEHVEHLPCQDATEAERYYQRLGMILCLGYILSATDLHLENIIASGDQPVLVDLETLLQVPPRAGDYSDTASADLRAYDMMQRSVLFTGLLPAWKSMSGKSFDLSGIGADEAQDIGYTVRVWLDTNTDRMRLRTRSGQRGGKTNQPVRDGQVVSARDHQGEIVAGFTVLYRLLTERRDGLLADAGPLAQFSSLLLRSVLRPTRSYELIERRLLHPEFLRDGADRSIELDRLAQPFVEECADPAQRLPWEIYVAERRALERFDVPFFTFRCDSTELSADGQLVVPDYFEQTGLQHLRSSLARLSEADLTMQAGFIRTAMHLRYASQPALVSHPPAALAAERDPGSACTRAELLHAARSVAEEIRRLAIFGDDGSATWLGLQFDPTTERMRLMPMASNLYGGRLGIALFLAALEHVTDGAGFRDLAEAALVPLRRALQQSLAPPSGWVPLGAASGLGSQLYGLVRIADFLGDTELRDLAQRRAAWFVPQRIAHDESLDVIGGAAGGILGLLALATAGGNGAALHPAALCGDHLLAKRCATDTGHRGWQLPWAPRPLTGFSHGAAGISYALLHLSRATGAARFREAAEEGIAYETAVYSPAAGNWPDFRELAGRQGQSFMSAWCHGATGIGLARLGGLSVLDTPDIRQDIDNALRTTLAVSQEGHDHLCCGSVGRLDFLIEASKRLGRPELLDEARRRASNIVRRAAREGGYRLHAQVPGVMDCVSLFQGLAGIGYQLLRLAEPEKLPCVLLWE